MAHSREGKVSPVTKRKIVKSLPDDFFPLPLPASDRCRDEFLHELLKSYESSTVDESTIATLSEESSSTQVNFGSGIYNAEARLMNDYLKGQRRSVVARKSVVAPDIFQMLKSRYDNIATAIGFLSVLFELSEVNNRMNAVRQSWRLESNADRSNHMFSWSIQHYFARFNMRSMAYLDALELELKGQLECFKFRKDLKEIIRLIDAVTDDFKSRRDICTNSMSFIKDAEVDIMELLSKSHKNIEIEGKRLAIAMQSTPRSADPKRLKYKALQAKINYMDFVVPIEARYRLNWDQNTNEQSLMYDDHILNEISKEIHYLKERSAEAKNLWQLSTLAYDMEIQDLRQRINDMERAYEFDMEHVDNEIQITTTKLVKAKDDLKFYREQVPIYHLKIEEVLDILENKAA